MHKALIRALVTPYIDYLFHSHSDFTRRSCQTGFVNLNIKYLIPDFSKRTNAKMINHAVVYFDMHLCYGSNPCLSSL